MEKKIYSMIPRLIFQVKWLNITEACSAEEVYIFYREIFRFASEQGD